MKLTFPFAVTALALSVTVDAQQTKPDSLPDPYATESVENYSEIIAWPEGQTPTAPAGFTVTRFASDFENPRWLYVTPNGDVLVAEATDDASLWQRAKATLKGKETGGKSADRITLLRDQDRDGKPEVRQIFLQDLNQPFGMLVIGNTLYVANTDGVVQFPYQAGQTQIKSTGKTIVELPAGGYNHHWTRNIVASPDQSKIYISVGSASNVGEYGLGEEIRRACILEANTDGKNERVYASGLRNPTGMAWAPGTNELWTAVNERDELGDRLVPDYLTQVREDGFYGWPFAYIGPHEDPRWEGKRPEKVQQTLVPDLLLDSHSASMGLVFNNSDNFPAKYQNGAFVAQHGSWNRSTLTGYRVVFVPFKDGKPAGQEQDFLTGFIASQDESKVYGRPVGLAILQDGSLLVADDGSDTIWRVAKD